MKSDFMNAVEEIIESPVYGIYYDSRNGKVIKQRVRLTCSIALTENQIEKIENLPHVVKIEVRYGELITLAKGKYSFESTTLFIHLNSKVSQINF